jgi:hypothetical protein
MKNNLRVPTALPCGWGRNLIIINHNYIPSLRVLPRQRSILRLFLFNSLQHFLRERKEHIFDAFVELCRGLKVDGSHFARVPAQQHCQQIHICGRQTHVSASSKLTFRFFSRSVLFPAITRQMSAPNIFLSSFTQLFTFWNESSSVMSYTKTAPFDDR